MVKMRNPERRKTDLAQRNQENAHSNNESGPTTDVAKAQVHPRTDHAKAVARRPHQGRVHVDVGPTGYPSDMTTSHGLWPGPRTEVGRGATTATPNPSRIGQTSRTPIGKYLLYFHQDTFFGSD
jgi:hypothetical protein